MSKNSKQATGNKNKIYWKNR